MCRTEITEGEGESAPPSLPRASNNLGLIGLKSLRDAFKESRLRVACYMAKSHNSGNRTVRRREQNKEDNAIVMQPMSTMEEVGVRLRFEDS